MLRTLIIDDEAHIRDTLRKLLARHCPQVSVVGEATGVEDGRSMIQKLKPDLVLLDVNLQDGTGFDLLGKIKKPSFSVIFISAFNKETFRDFRLTGHGFLTKPVNPEELVSMVKHAVVNRKSG